MPRWSLLVLTLAATAALLPLPAAAHAGVDACDVLAPCRPGLPVGAPAGLPPGPAADAWPWEWDWGWDDIVERVTFVVRSAQCASGEDRLACAWVAYELLCKRHEDVFGCLGRVGDGIRQWYL